MSIISGLPPQHRQQVHWRAFEWAYKRLSLVSRLPIFKLIHDKWTPAMAIAKFDADKNPQCVCCNLHVETFKHIFQCSSKLALNIHKTSVVKLRKTLQKCDTAPVITEAISQLLEQARKGYCDFRLRNVLATEEMKELTQKTMTLQLSMEITYLLKGYMFRQWAVIQYIYRKQKGFNDDNTCWMRSLIKAIWDYSASIWKKRCEQVHGHSEKSIRMRNRKEIIKTIQEHLRRTKYHPDHNVQQLRRNISRSIGNANITSLQTWLRMISDIK